MNNRAFLILLAIMLFLISCDTQIDPSAANSVSAIIATLGEYTYAIITVFLIFILSLVRGVGIGTTVFGLLLLIIDNEITLNPTCFLTIGLLLFAISFVPIKQYTPKVNISRKKMTIINTSEKGVFMKEIISPIVISIVTLVIEYVFFVH